MSGSRAEGTRGSPPYEAALQRPFIDALMNMSAAESSMPVARAINTAPLVAMNGNIIDGVGLDRQSGLIHRIEPQLRACLPMPPADRAGGARGPASGCSMSGWSTSVPT